MIGHSLKVNFFDLVPIDLPYMSKFLLFAAFFASYNPARFDVRFFSKGKDNGASKRQSQNGSKIRQQLLGPKTFPVERMLAIFYSLIRDHVDSSDVYSQVIMLIVDCLAHLIASTDKGWFC